MATTFFDIITDIQIYSKKNKNKQNLSELRDIFTQNNRDIYVGMLLIIIGTLFLLIR